MKDKLFIPGTAVVLIILLVYIAHFQFIGNRDKMVNLYTEKQMMIARQAAIGLENYVKDRMKILEILAGLSSSGLGDNKDFDKCCHGKIEGLENIIFLNNLGQIIGGYGEDFTTLSNQFDNTKENFKKTFQQLRQSQRPLIYTNNVLFRGNIYTYLMAPVYSAENRFQGAVAGVVKIQDALEIALTPIINDSSDYAWLLNDQGYLIYHPSHEEMLLNNVLSHSQECIECHINFDFETEMLNGVFGGGIKQHNRIETQLIGYSRISLENVNWIIAVSSSYFEVTEAVKAQHNIFLLLVLAMTATVVPGVFFIYRINAKKISAQKEAKYLKEKTKLMEEKESVESRYRILIEQSPNPIFLYTRRGFISTNKSFEELFGYDKQEIFNGNFDYSKLFISGTLKNIEKQFVQFVRSQQRFTQITTHMIDRNKKNLDVEISIGRFLLEKRITYQGIIHDVTESRKTEREQRQREHLAMIGEMATRIAHEIKNPLASIQTGIQLLESQLPQDSNDRQYFKRLTDEIKRVDTILKGFLSYAREDHLNKRELDLDELIKHFTDVIQPTMDKKSIHFIVKTDKHIPNIYADKQKLEQVFWNLLLNAIQSSQPDKTIRLTLSKNGNGVDICIKDEGEGISQENLPKLFFPFFSTRIHGSGLGLPISKKIIQAHNGTITIKSRVNKGTAVKIHLPER